MIPVTFRPLEFWPEPFMPRRSPFDSSWSATLDLLDRELHMLGAERAVIQIGLRESQIRIDGWPKATATAPAHPGVVLAFDSNHGPLKYATAEFHDWKSNVRAIALGLEALRKVDRYGITKRGEQYTGWRALPAGDGTELDRGRELIEKHGGLVPALKATHPDHGGDSDDFRAVQTAKAGR